MTAYGAEMPALALPSASPWILVSPADRWPKDCLSVGWMTTAAGDRAQLPNVQEMTARRCKVHAVGGGSVTMPKPKDPVEVVAGIRESIEVSPKHSRKVLCQSLRNSFGWKVFTPERKERVTKLLQENGILAEPSLFHAGLNEWITLSMLNPDHQRTDKWFQDLMTVGMVSEKDVELKFVSPLFHALGYENIHEAAGYGFRLDLGSSHKRVEADFVYFEDADHSRQTGSPLVLVEAKAPGLPLDVATWQAQSYANCLKPTYYVVTDGDLLIVWDYLAAVRDDKKMELKRAELQHRFGDLYHLLNRERVIKARIAKMKKFSPKK
jgi:Type I restriction enzyme R protein N terminus (HSDR_N)